MNDAVRHAKSYPFAIPGHSYLFDRGGFTRLEAADADLAGRTPVLAAGSNQSPEQLARKYAGFDDGPDAVIPAQRGRLHDFDVVYAAHLSRYGSLPATFQASPGTAVTVFVVWLTDRQLVRMHETEGNYTYDHLEAVTVSFDDGGSAPETVYAYSSKVGCFCHEGDCASLAEIAAENRRFRALTQIEALAALRDRLAPGEPLDEFIASHVADDEVRRLRSEALRLGAVPLGFQRRIISHL